MKILRKRMFLIFLLAFTICVGQTKESKNGVSSFDIITGYAEDGMASTINYNYHVGNKSIYQLCFTFNDAEEEILTYKFPYIDTTLSFSYNKNILSNGQFNTFNVYLGVGVLVGYEYINNGINVLSNGAELKIKSKMLYGANAQLQAELYLADNIYLTSQITENIHINSDLGKFLFYAGVGLRMYIL